MRPPIVAGVAGGVGTTTVHFLLPASVDGGLYRGGYVDVLVCQSTVSSLKRAHRMIVAIPGKPILVVVQDSPVRPPRSARALSTMVEPHVYGIVNVPYIPEWRGESDPWRLAATAATSAEVAKSLRPLQAAHRDLMDLVTKLLPWHLTTGRHVPNPAPNGHPQPPIAGGYNSAPYGRTPR